MSILIKKMISDTCFVIYRDKEIEMLGLRICIIGFRDFAKPIKIF